MNVELNKFSKEYAHRLDQEDPIANFRNHFHIPQTAAGHDEIYFCGNSLGLMPKGTSQFILDYLEDWKKYAVKGHSEAKKAWIPYHEYARPALAQIVGALEHEVTVMNSLTVNLHLMMISFYQPQGKRKKIVIEKTAFPSDYYAVQSQLQLHHCDPVQDLILIDAEEGSNFISLQQWQKVFEQYQDDIALVLVPGVQYLSGQFFDIEKITKMAHAIGAIVGADLAHAVGNVPLKLHDWQVDFAVWCHYKYLNSGPGAVAGCYLHENHGRKTNLQRLAGWWGNIPNNRFLMKPEFEASPDVTGWQLSNPPIISLASVLSSLEVFAAAGYIEPLRKKSLKMSQYLLSLLESNFDDEIQILTPANPDERGCQVSLRVKADEESKKRVFHSLMEQGVTCDWREPDVIRLAPVPLYNSFSDIYHFAKKLEEALP